MKLSRLFLEYRINYTLIKIYKIVDFKGIKYVFTQEDGANMLLNRFKELQVVDEVAITN